jgi:hypothetical protein
VSIPRFKLVTSNSIDRFEERLAAYIDQLDRDEMVVDVKFATAAIGTSVEFTALVQTQKTESWS